MHKRKLLFLNLVLIIDIVSIVLFLMQEVVWKVLIFLVPMIYMIMWMTHMM